MGDYLAERIFSISDQIESIEYGGNTGSSESAYDALKRLYAERDALTAQFEAEIAGMQRNTAAWREKWPNACKACRGHGGSVFYETHGQPGTPEQLFDPCDALDVGMCHRCGERGLSRDDEGPCAKCGWNYDDGEPE